LKESLESLPGLVKARDDYEASLESQPLIDANKEYQAAAAAIEVPKASHKAWVEMSDARMDNLKLPMKHTKVSKISWPPKSKLRQSLSESK